MKYKGNITNDKIGMLFGVTERSGAKKAKAIKEHFGIPSGAKLSINHLAEYHKVCLKHIDQILFFNCTLKITCPLFVNNNMLAAWENINLNSAVLRMKKIRDAFSKEQYQGVSIFDYAKFCGVDEKHIVLATIVYNLEEPFNDMVSDGIFISIKNRREMYKDFDMSDSQVQRAHKRIIQQEFKKEPGSKMFFLEDPDFYDEFLDVSIHEANRIVLDVNKYLSQYEVDYSELIKFPKYLIDNMGKLMSCSQNHEDIHTFIHQYFKGIIFDSKVVL